MKYLALLRDSFRESLDSKVIYFTFGLSFLLILILLSVSFRPVTVKDEVELACSTANWVFGMQANNPFHDGPAHCELTEFKQLTETDNPWEGEFEFNVTLTQPKSMVAGNEGKQNRFMVKGMIIEGLKWTKERDITEKGSDDGEKVDFLGTVQGPRVENWRHGRHEASLFFGAVPLTWFRTSLARSVHWIEDFLVNNIGAWVIILIGIIVTAFFIPSMLEKGSVDLLLVKPLTRVELLLFKYLGGLSFVFVNSLVAIGGVWLILGLRTGIWTFGFLLTILVITFFFAILYSVSTLFGVLTRSSVLSIFVTCLFWFGLFLLGVIHSFLNTEVPRFPAPVHAQEEDRQEKVETISDSDPILRVVANVVNVFHAVLPRTSELGQLNTKLISEELLSEEERQSEEKRRQARLDRTPEPNWLVTLGGSFAFIAVMLGLACWRFAVRDY